MMERRPGRPRRHRKGDGVPLQVEHVEHRLSQHMKAAKLDPVFIYAFERTGLMVTEANSHLLSAEDLAEWEAAVREYCRKHPGT